MSEAFVDSVAIWLLVEVLLITRYKCYAYVIRLNVNEEKPRSPELGFVYSGLIKQIKERYAEKHYAFISRLLLL